MFVDKKNKGMRTSLVLSVSFKENNMSQLSLSSEFYCVKNKKKISKTNKN